MLFWLKKFISFWLMPLPICVALVVGGWWIARTAKRRWLGRTLSITGFVLLLLFGNSWFSGWLIHPLEARYAAVPELTPDTPLPASLRGCRYVVVLGSGHGNTPDLPATSQLAPSGLARITEAVRLLRVLPDARLVVSGPADGDHEAHATVLARAARSLGIAPDRITLIDQAHDTEDESNAVARIVKDAPFALVTSAFHMPRAMALCHHVGLTPLPCPCDYYWHTNNDFRWQELFWDPSSMDRSTIAVRERIGYVWIWLRGRT